MVKKAEFSVIRQAYETIYRQCVIKYFSFSKAFAKERDIFSFLPTFCWKLMQQIQNSQHSSIAYEEAQKVVWAKMMSFNEADKFQQTRLLCSGNFLKKKKFFDAAYLLGYGYHYWTKDIRDQYNNEDSLQKRGKIWSSDELLVFFREIAAELGKTATYQEISDHLRQIFDKYHVPFRVD